MNKKYNPIAKCDHCGKFCRWDGATMEGYSGMVVLDCGCHFVCIPCSKKYDAEYWEKWHVGKEYIPPQEIDEMA